MKKKLKAWRIKPVCLRTMCSTNTAILNLKFHEWRVIEFMGKKIALTICEDIWNLGDNPLYRVCPMDELIIQQPDIMINISASPFDYDHDEDRKEVIKAQCAEIQITDRFIAMQ